MQSNFTCDCMHFMPHCAIDNKITILILIDPWQVVYVCCSIADSPSNQVKGTRNPRPNTNTNYAVQVLEHLKVRCLAECKKVLVVKILGNMGC